MIKAGLIGSVVGFIYVMGLTLLSPFCTICFIPLLGLGTGYLAARFDAPIERRTSLYRGGIAGGIAGLIAVVGQMLGSVVNGILVTHSDRLPELMSEAGFAELWIADPGEYWQATLSLNAFCGALNLIIVVGLAAIGGLIWFHKHSLTTAGGFG